MRFKTLLPLMVMACAALSLTALAEKSDWMEYASPTKLFKLRTPVNAKEEFPHLRLGPESAVISGTMTSSLPKEDNPQRQIYYIVKVDQTFGPAPKETEAGDILQREVKAYMETYKGLNGVLKDHKEEIVQGGFPGSEIYITYDDPELGPQSIRSRIFLSDIAKFQQILIGDEDVMNALESRNYFDSLVLYNGPVKTEGSLTEDWRAVTSPFQIFTVYLPSAGTPFTPDEYESAQSNRAEKISFHFYDPLRHQFLQFNFYGYRMSKNFSQSFAEDTLEKQHLSRLRHGYSSEEKEQYVTDGVTYIETKMNAVPPKAFPYMNQAIVKARYKGAYMAVMEVLGTPELVYSDFTKNVMDTFTFHPDKAMAP